MDYQIAVYRNRRDGNTDEQESDTLMEVAGSISALLNSRDNREWEVYVEEVPPIYDKTMEAVDPLGQDNRN
jgi:hypothetical protein